MTLRLQVPCNLSQAASTALLLRTSLLVSRGVHFVFWGGGVSRSLGVVAPLALLITRNRCGRHIADGEGQR